MRCPNSCINITNLYVASGSYRAKINGFYYIGHTGNFAWSHFETKQRSARN